jgi:hypothetical protein
MFLLKSLEEKIPLLDLGINRMLWLSNIKELEWEGVGLNELAPLVQAFVNAVMNR